MFPNSIHLPPTPYATTPISHAHISSLLVGRPTHSSSRPLSRRLDGKIRIRYGARLRSPVRQLSTLTTSPLCLIVLKVLNCLLDLRPQVGAVKGSFVDYNTAVARCAVPSHAVDGLYGAALLENNAHCVGKAHRVVRGVGGQQKHITLADDDVSEGAVVDDFEHHCAAVLVKPLWGLVDVVISASVGAANNL